MKRKLYSWEIGGLLLNFIGALFTVISISPSSTAIIGGTDAFTPANINSTNFHIGIAAIFFGFLVQFFVMVFKQKYDL